MHSLSIWTKSITAATANEAVTPLQDQIFNIQNNGYMFPQDRRLLCAYAGGVDITTMLVDSPTLSQNGNPAIYPLDTGALGGNLPAFYYPFPNGMTFPARESIRMLATNANVAAQQAVVMAFHTRQFRQAPPGPYKTIMATCTGAGGNLVWSSPLTLSLVSGLRRGRYVCVGLAADGTNLLGARLIFPDFVERPGCLCEVSSASYTDPYFRNGNIGVFGEFDNDNLPQLEAFGTGALSGTIRVFLDIVNVPLAF